MSDHLAEHWGPLTGTVRGALERLAPLVPRVWRQEHTVWQQDPTEVADRLGWLTAPSDYLAQTTSLTGFADEVREDGITEVLLVGMGGSSLYPEVLASVREPTSGAPRLTVLDSTHPHAVRRVTARLDWSRALLVAASKSGTTVETRSHLAHFRAVLADSHGTEAAQRVVAITDPGSALAALGREDGFRAVFENDPHIGGRFSALSLFGLVPAALLGIDLRSDLETAVEMQRRARATSAEDNGPLRLGALLGAAAEAGRDKLTVLLPEALAPFGAWIEQLVAESTGKGGAGLLPVVDEPLLAADAYGDDRVFVAYGAPERLDGLVAAGHPVVVLPDPGPRALAGEVFRWEFATAMAGAHLGLNPFDQPDVQAAKTAATRALEEGATEVEATDPAALLETVGAGDYLALLAFVDPGGQAAARLPQVAQALRDAHGVPVTIGIGPRYLHSTGQLHKGGPDRGVFLVTTEPVTDDVSIPGQDATFGQLLRAQAAGDLAALTGAGRRAGRVQLDGLLALA